MRNKKGFTLVELLAVIVILAIILVIAIPQILKVINSSRLAAFKSTSELLINQAEKQYLVDQTLNSISSSAGGSARSYSGTIGTEGSCTDLTELNTNDYETCSISVGADGKAMITLLEGKGKFAGYTCAGTKNNISCSGNGETIGSLSNNSSLICDAGYYKSGNECVSCPAGTSSLAGSTSISACETLGNYVISNAEMWDGLALPSGVNVRNIPSLAMQDWASVTGIANDTRPIFLKYIITNNTIEKSYLGFVITDEMASANEGMVAGTYTLLGGYFYTESEAKYANNLNIVKTAFDYDNHSSRCQSYSNDPYHYDFECSIADFEVKIHHYGQVEATYKSHTCRIHDDGLIGCW